MDSLVYLKFSRYFKWANKALQRSNGHKESLEERPALVREHERPRKYHQAEAHRLKTGHLNFFLIYALPVASRKNSRAAQSTTE